MLAALINTHISVLISSISAQKNFCALDNFPDSLLQLMTQASECLPLCDSVIWGLSLSDTHSKQMKNLMGNFRH